MVFQLIRCAYFCSETAGRVSITCQPFRKVGGQFKKDMQGGSSGHLDMNVLFSKHAVLPQGVSAEVISMESSFTDEALYVINSWRVLCVLSCKHFFLSSFVCAFIDLGLSSL